MNQLDVKSSQILHQLAFASDDPKFFEVQLLRKIAVPSPINTLKKVFNETNGELPQTLPQFANAVFKDTTCAPYIIYFVKNINKKKTLIKVLTKCLSKAENPKIYFVFLKDEERGEEDSLKVTKITTPVKKSFKIGVSFKTTKIYYSNRINTQHKVCFH